MLVDLNSLEHARGVLLDLDGTLVTGTHVLPGARDLLEAVDGRFAIVSNNAEHTPVELAAMLEGLGLTVPADRIVLAGTVALAMLAAESPGAHIMLIGSPSLRAFACEHGLQLDDERPDFVVVGRDRDFSFQSIMKAANAVRSGARLVVANPDRTHPRADGGIVPETGSLAAAILSCTGPVDHRVIGKPERGLFVAGMALLGSTPEQTVMIGDNADTDGLGAKRMGIRFLHVTPRLATAVPLRAETEAAIVRAIAQG